MEFTIGNFLIVSLLIVGTFSFTIAGGIQHKGLLLDYGWPLSEMIQQAIKLVEKEGQAEPFTDQQAAKPVRMRLKDPLRDYILRKLSEMGPKQNNKDSPKEVEKAGQVTTTMDTPSAGEYNTEDLLFDIHFRPLLEKIQKNQEKNRFPK
ncbi:unnamed protein product [Orchesella dallaii]|uniref:Uncharacterized protein n=1 Tax=Orchesella dallaii TaxID=48710 RepID=A0ABP1PPH9_9HEXA